MLRSKTFELTSLPNEVLSLHPLVDLGYNSSQEKLNFYDLSDHDLNEKTVKEVGNHSKLEQILTYLGKGIIFSICLIRTVLY